MQKTNWNFLFALSLVLALGLTGLVLWRTSVALAPVEIPVLRAGSALEYSRLADQFARQEQFSVATSLNKQALNYHPDSASLHYNQAWLAARQRQWPAALVEVNHALELEPDAQTYVLRAWIYQQQERLSSARQDLERARQMGWKSESPIEQARFLQLTDQHQAALKIYALLIKQAPTAELFYWRSLSYQALGQTQVAIDDLSQWLSGHPQADAYLQRAHLYLKLGDLSAAFKDYQQSLSLQADAESQDQRDLLWTYLDPAAALTDFQQRESTRELKLKKVRALLALKKTKLAQQELDELLKEEAGLAEIQLLQARSFRLRRKYTDASQALSRARSLKPDPQELLLEQARLFAQQGQKQEASARVHQLLKNNPESLAILKTDRLLSPWIK